jgi:hypothetical protein
VTCLAALLGGDRLPGATLCRALHPFKSPEIFAAIEALQTCMKQSRLSCGPLYPAYFAARPAIFVLNRDSVPYLQFVQDTTDSNSGLADIQCVHQLGKRQTFCRGSEDFKR